jgi:phage N-6-adenine-methyltransferase
MNHLVRYDQARHALQLAQGTDLVIAKLESARVALYEATTIPEAKRFVDMGMTAETWAKQQKLGDEITSYAHSFTIDALANLGRMLKETPRNEGQIRRGTKLEPRENPPTLAALGLDKKTSSIAQKLASLPAEQLAAVRGANTSVTTALQVVQHNHRAQGTGENEWYTPKEYVEAARKALGVIELDPASSEIAQQIVKAKHFYTKERDGLSRKWEGRVWLNPPYSQPAVQQFIEKLVAEVKARAVTEAVLLTHNYTDTEWFHIAARACSLICFTRGRIKFVGADGSIAAPTQGQAFFYFGKRVQSFTRAFESFGFIR